MSALVSSILHFLNSELFSENHNEEQKESLQVAIDCIQRAYNTNYDSNSSYHDLNQLFRDLGLEDIIRKPELAEQQKLRGNELLGQGKAEEAIECYTKAIELDCTSHIYFGNRAAAYIKLNKLEEAIQDCYNALHLKNDYSKGYARLGTIFMMKKDYYNANINLAKACELEPENVSYKETLEQCQSFLSQQDPSHDQGAQSSPFGDLGNVDFNAIMNNPAVINMAQNMMQNPRMQELFSGLMSNLQGGSNDSSNPLASMFQNLGNPPSGDNNSNPPNS